MKRAYFPAVAMVGAVVLTSTFVAGNIAAKDKGRGNNDQLGTIYVESQGLYYDTFKTTDLAPHGRFQQLYPTGGPGGVSSTEFGPGDPGYLGGRWWIDMNPIGMDDTDVYFSCPLLGPGHATP